MQNEKEQNEFKFSTLRQFGSEQVSFTSTIHSDKTALSKEEIAEQIAQFDLAITEAFKSAMEREISEKDLLITTSERRREAVAKLDDALKTEMKVKSDAQKTMKEAERKSK